MKTMPTSWTSRCYDAWAYIYDRTFGALVHKRHLRAMQHLRSSPGAVVLDLGVGTGMMLGDYPRDVTVIGADLSAGMLAKAMNKKRELGLDHVTLVQADAMFPPLAEGVFDQVMIAHTISVVSEPARLLQWAERLVKPGGRVVLLNHFHSPNRLVGWFERVLNPVFMKIGWKSDLALEDCLAGTSLHVHYLFKTSWLDLWQIAVLSHEPAGAAETASASSSEPVDVPKQHEGAGLVSGG